MKPKSQLVFSRSTHRYCAPLILSALAFTAGAVQAAPFTWGGGNLNWTDTSASGWNGGPPNTGDTAVISSGQVEVTAAITGTAPITIGAGGQFWLNANSLTVSNDFVLNGTTSGGAIVSGDRPANNVNTLSGQITLNSTSNIASWWNDKTLQISGKITGAGGLTLDRATSIGGGGDPAGARFIISGTNNDYSGGTTVNGRVAGDLYGFPAQTQVFLGANNALPSGSALTLNTGDLYLNGYAQTLSDINGTGTNRVRNGSATAGSLTMNVATTSSFGGTMGGGGSNENNFSLTKTGNGTLTLSGANTYTGATNVSNGTLELQSSAISNFRSATTIASGATMKVTGDTTPYVGGYYGGLALGSAASGTVTIDGSGTLVINNYVGLGNGGGAATTNFALGSGGLIDIQSGALVNGGWGKATWSSNRADMNIASGAFFDIWDGNAVTIDALTGTGTVRNGANDPSSNKILNIGADNGTGTFSGVIGGGLGGGSNAGIDKIAVTKTGTGTQTLSGTNTYIGTTTVSGGSLIINGNISTSSLTTVETGASLSGSGTVGPLTIDSGGSLNPGNSPGILTVDGNYSQAGTLTIEVAGLTAGTQHDQVNVNRASGDGSVTLSGSLVTAFSAGTYANGDLLFILLNDESDAISGTFSGLAQDAIVTTYGGFDWKISYTADSTANTFTGGNDIALMAVPEPSTALLGGLGLLALLRRRR